MENTPPHTPLFQRELLRHAARQKQLSSELHWLIHKPEPVRHKRTHRKESALTRLLRLRMRRLLPHLGLLGGPWT